jgi:hypothetical protein
MCVCVLPHATTVDDDDDDDDDDSTRKACWVLSVSLSDAQCVCVCEEVEEELERDSKLERVGKRGLSYTLLV